MRLEPRARVGDCKLWVTPEEHEALRLGIPDAPPQLPEFVLEHLREHGHLMPLPPMAALNLPPSRPLFGLDIYIERE